MILTPLPKPTSTLQLFLSHTHARSDLSDAHFSLAVAYVYYSSDKDSGVEDPVDEKRKALAHYRKAREVCRDVCE